MAAKISTVWAVDIGNTSLRGIHLRLIGDEVSIIGIDKVEHSQYLFSSGLTDQQRKGIIADSMRVFVERNNIDKKESVAVSVPGQNSFARFISLPPVEPKGIPKIVQYEAVQQIPFDINEVEWDWQLMEKPDSPEAEVGIFAIKNELINAAIEPFQNESLKVTTVQMSPMALYNFACYECKELDDDGKKAVILINMGAENTELVICSKTKVWQRCIPLGGNNFTNAIADAFKLNFEKAEKLKKTAPMSKYVKQIFHAMRPVFTDMGAEIQRSIGYFSSTSRSTKFVKVIALGGAMRLQGVTKYLQQSLNMPVERPEEFESLGLGEGLSPVKVAEVASDCGAVIGLGLQNLGLAVIRSNLLPRRIARSMAWQRKSQVMTIAAGVMLAVCLLSLGKVALDNKSYNDAEKLRSQIQSVIQKADNATRKLESEQNRQSQYEKLISAEFDLFKYRDTLPQLKQLLLKCVPNIENNPAQAAVYAAFNSGDVEALTKFPRKQRKQMFITSMNIRYSEDLATAQFGQNQTRTRTTRTRGETGGGGMMPGGMGMPGMGMPGGADFGFPMGGGGGGRRTQPRQTDQEQTAKEGAGFIVEIEGYSPYNPINQLLDPINPGDDNSKWGFVTRLKRLNELVDGNLPFEVFDTASTANFIQETGEVSVDSSDMPMGIGIEKVVQRAPKAVEAAETRGRGATATGSKADIVYEETVLVDPMTGEEISKTLVLDDNYRRVYDTYDKPQYTVNDYWFRVKVKILFKDSVAVGGKKD